MAVAMRVVAVSISLKVEDGLTVVCVLAVECNWAEVAALFVSS